MMKFKQTKERSEDVRQVRERMKWQNQWIKGPGEHYGFWIWDTKRNQPDQKKRKKEKILSIVKEEKE